MIVFHNVRYSIGNKEIIKGISFCVPGGESRIIMGHSGSGKSTILRLTLGLATPDIGDIIVDGKSIIGMKDKDLREIRKRIGMVFQDGALFDSLTVGENVGYYLLEHTKLKFVEIEDRVREMLGYVGLEDEIIDRLPAQLSGGMQRRVAIGRALLSTDPKIMLYDEPTTGLDPEMASQIIALINRLAGIKRVTSIIVTHQIADAFEISDKFIIVSDGMIVFDGDLTALRNSSDPVVINFLKPFRDAVANVKRKEFV